MTSKTFSLIPSLDVTSLDEAARLVEAVQAHPFVYGFKVGFSLGLAQGLPRTVETIRRLTAKPVIYDHQKAATDIPATGALFARVLADAGIDEVILFPQAGPATLEAWAEAMAAKGLKTIVGVVMTHAKYLQGEGGYLADSSPVDIARRAKAAGVKAFVTPLTKPELVARLAEETPFGEGDEFYSPGLGAQGGDPKAFPALRTHRLIVGRSLMNAPDPLAYVDSLAASL